MAKAKEKIVVMNDEKVRLLPGMKTIRGMFDEIKYKGLSICSFAVGPADEGYVGKLDADGFYIGPWNVEGEGDDEDFPTLEAAKAAADSQKKRRRAQEKVNQRLYITHQNEARKKGAEFNNYGWATSDDGICSKTTKGFLETAIDRSTNKITHKWS